MVFISRQFPGHSRTGIPLHSWNVLVLLELWHGAISLFKNIYLSVGTQRIHYQVKMKVHIKAKVGATNTDFIGSMHTGMLLCFHWNIF